MPKSAKSNIVKVNEMERLYPTEFLATPDCQLMCLLCEHTVRFEKVHFAQHHRQSAKHQKMMQSQSVTSFTLALNLLFKRQKLVTLLNK